MSNPTKRVPPTQSLKAMPRWRRESRQAQAEEAEDPARAALCRKAAASHGAECLFRLPPNIAMDAAHALEELVVPHLPANYWADEFCDDAGTLGCAVSLLCDLDSEALDKARDYLDELALHCGRGQEVAALAGC